MDNTTNSAEPCCAGAQGCGCGPPRSRRSWLMTALTALTLLAAVGVGAYSLVH